jgi:hypothetical protein
MENENKTSENLQGHESSTEGAPQGKTEISITAKPIGKNSGFGGMNLSEDVADKLNKVTFGADETAKGKLDESPDKGQDESKKETAESSKEATTKAAETEATKGSEFLTALTTKIDELKLTPEDEKVFMDDVLVNWPKFRKANIERSQALAEREKVLGDLELVEGLSRLIQTDKVKSSLDMIASDNENLEALRGITKDFYDPNGEGKPNPVMEIIDMILSSEPEAEKVTAKQRELEAKEIELEINDHTVQLKGLDKRYTGDAGKEELQSTTDLALENGVDLLTAHKIRMGTESQKVIEESQAKIKVLNDELVSTRKQLEELKKKTPAPADTRNREEASKTDFSGQKDIKLDIRSQMNNQMDEAERRVRAKLQMA